MPNEETFRPSDATAITRRYLDSILLEMRIINAVTPSISFDLFGKTFDTPIMMPAFSHLHLFVKEREDGMGEYFRAAKALNAVNFVGMTTLEEYDRLAAIGATTVRIVKPYADKDQIFARFEQAEKTGALAVGMDIDHIFGRNGSPDTVHGNLLAPQSTADLKEYVRSTKLPFVAKGVLSVRDAVQCVEAGVQAIFLSHHHGRVPFAIPPLMILPEIRKAVGNSIRIFVDCSISTGADVLKALALGADAASPGRALMEPLRKDGQAGVENYIRGMNDQLSMLIAYTGCKTLSDLEPSILWINGKPAEP